MATTSLVSSGTHRFPIIPNKCWKMLAEVLGDVTPVIATGKWEARRTEKRTTSLLLGRTRVPQVLVLALQDYSIGTLAHNSQNVVFVHATSPQLTKKWMISSINWSGQFAWYLLEIFIFPPWSQIPARILAPHLTLPFASDALFSVAAVQTPHLVACSLGSR